MLFIKRTLAPFLFGVLFTSLSGFGQDITKNKFGKGIQITAADSSFAMKFGLRFQTLYDGRLNLENQNYNDQFLIRRYRLKFDGWAYHPNIMYKLEVGISNRDHGGGNIPQTGLTSSLILDALIKWNFKPSWSLWIGQTKLPGNRERVISSQALQFVDRSNLNSKFNIDRDAGVQLHYEKDKFNFISSISMGEGRNIVTNNSGGYDYTLRAEYLPFGAFTGGGDYFSADLKREPKPKLSLGITYDYNDRAMREGGQLGDFLTAQRDLETWFLDAHFKYNGFSSILEYANKKSPDGAVIVDGIGNLVEAFYTGSGINWQAGYLFKSNFEIAGRFTKVTPEKITLRNENTQYTLGLSRYIVGHNLKIQSDITLIKEDSHDDQLMARMTVELAF
ncbi:MAG: FmdC precursor [Cyclobacteriaceae bacterium]|nr:FmdC precursor [Cyclobacteriaceae bacterium]